MESGSAAGFPSSSGEYRLYPLPRGNADSGPQGGTGEIYLLPPSYNGEQAIPIKLPLLITDNQAPEYKNDYFHLSFAEEGVTATAAIWSTAPSDRAKIRAGFIDLLEKAEGFEETALAPGAARRIAIAIADAVPAPLVETLFFRYGLNPGFLVGTAPYVDVVPGLRLRIQAQASQFLAPGSPGNLYLPAGELLAEIGTTRGGSNQARRVLAFDPFLATIRAPVVEGTSPTPALAAGLVDLAPAGGTRKHWRLFAPQKVSPPGQPGKLTAEGNFALVGADSRAALEAAAGSYPDPPSTGEQPLYLVFPGRALVEPEIPIWLTLRGLSTLEHVPLGTTVANLVERYTSLPLDPKSWTSKVRVTRITTAQSEGKAEVSIFTKTLTALPPELFDLPLIAGDSVILTGAS